MLQDDHVLQRRRDRDGRMMSAATRNSSPSRMARPRPWRYVRYIGRTGRGGGPRGRRRSLPWRSRRRCRHADEFDGPRRLHRSPTSRPRSPLLRRSTAPAGVPVRPSATRRTSLARSAPVAQDEELEVHAAIIVRVRMERRRKAAIPAARRRPGSRRHDPAHGAHRTGRRTSWPANRHDAPPSSVTLTLTPRRRGILIAVGAGDGPAAQREQLVVRARKPVSRTGLHVAPRRPTTPAATGG